MADEKEQKTAGSEERFRYIGYDVYSKKPKEFWENKEEEKKYLEQAKKKKGHQIDREHSMVLVSVFSKVDRIIITISSILMIIGFLLPWFSLNLGERTISYNLFGYIGKLSLILSYSHWSGSLLVVFALLVLLFMLVSLAYAVLSLVFILKREEEKERYYHKVKRILQLGFIPIVLWIVLAIISMFGFKTPFLSGSGIKQLGESLNLITFLSLTGYGMWVVFCCLVVNSFKSNDL